MLDLLAWRRTIADLYATIRAEPDPVIGWRRWQDGRNELFRHHAQSPIEDRAAFTSIPCFDYDPAFRFLVGAVATEGPEVVFDAGQDGVVRMHAFARTDGLAPRLGRELSLYWIAGYGGGVFLPFSDATNGRSTYGAGRYLLDTIKGADLGQAPNYRLVLDFNFAYNPSCSYSDRYVCPLAPPENRLGAEVEAGERSSK